MIGRYFISNLELPTGLRDDSLVLPILVCFLFCTVICVKVAYFMKIQFLRNVFVFETGSHCESLSGFNPLDLKLWTVVSWELNQGPLE